MLLTMLLAAGVASGEIKAPRPSGYAYQTAMPMDELKICVARTASPFGRIHAFDAEGRHHVEVYMDATLMRALQAKLGFVLSDLGGIRAVTSVYRRPMSAGFARNMLKAVHKSCSLEGEASPSSIVTE